MTDHLMEGLRDAPFDRKRRPRNSGPEIKDTGQMSLVLPHVKYTLDDSS